jgi:hypothetical protein
MKVVVAITSEQLDRDDLHLLLQAIRDCEQGHFKDKEIFVGVDVPDLTMDEMGEIVKGINPPYNYGPFIFKYKGDKSERD